MKKFEAAVEIAAAAQTIWSILCDASRYTEWNTTVERVEGTITNGGRVTVHAKIAPGRAFPLTVGDWNPPSRMSWAGGMPLGLFRGKRDFVLTPAGAGRVRFTMTEQYSGLMAGLITRSIPDLQPAFEQFAADLKARAETADA